MRNISSIRWSLLGIVFVVVGGVLGFYGNSGAAPPQPPFVDAGEQRAEMLRELRAIRDLLQEQNKLLKAGQTKTDDTKNKTKR